MNTETFLWQCLCNTENKKEAFGLFVSENASFVDVNTSSRVNFHSVFKEINSISLETEKPIYNMIMDLEAIELHKLSKIIESKGGKILDLKTDCIRCSFDDEIPFKLIDYKNIDGYFFDSDNMIPNINLKHLKNLILKENQDGYEMKNIFFLIQNGILFMMLK